MALSEAAFYICWSLYLFISAGEGESHPENQQSGFADHLESQWLYEGLEGMVVVIILLLLVCLENHNVKSELFQKCWQEACSGLP